LFQAGEMPARRIENNSIAGLLAMECLHSKALALNHLIKYEYKSQILSSAISVPGLVILVVVIAVVGF